MNTLQQYQNNPIINKTNITLERLERLEEMKMNKLIKLNLIKIKKEFNHKKNVIVYNKGLILF